MFSSFAGAFLQMSTQQVSVHELAHLHVCGGVADEGLVCVHSLTRVWK